jgi:hypothetical protein
MPHKIVVVHLLLHRKAEQKGDYEREALGARADEELGPMLGAAISRQSSIELIVIFKRCNSSTQF